jgi:hypothetical protein
LTEAKDEPPWGRKLKRRKMVGVPTTAQQVKKLLSIKPESVLGSA